VMPKVGHFSTWKGFWRLGETKIWTGAPPYESAEVIPAGKQWAGSPPGILLTFADDVQLVAVPPPPPEPEEEQEADGQDVAATDQQTAAAQQTAGEEVEVLGFRIAGKGKGQRKFVPAQAKIDGNRVFVYSNRVTQPAVVGYGEGQDSPNVVLRRRGATDASQDRALESFRSYVERAEKVYTFWHIAAFAWICNLAMHLGLSDMALFRFARHWWYGVYSAFGMFLGHYVAWICAGIMGAGVASVAMMDSPLTLLDSGEVAFRALGVMGALAVVIAGWTTSNPTLYRAGLALQVVTPGWPRWLVTLLAGVVTTAVACFPFVFRQLLNFVGIYGLLLMPVGAIVVTEHWIFPLLGLKRYWSSRKGQLINWPASIAWLVALLFALGCWRFDLLHLFGPALHSAGGTGGCRRPATGRRRVAGCRSRGRHGRGGASSGE